MPSINHISDFPDKLNPVLVKELRQGLRGVSFVTLFIGIQAFLCFILLITGMVASLENAGHLLSRIIFFFFSLAVLIVQPLRGVGALHGEIRNNTIDLLCLTRLSAWRITYGKWISIVGQSALILTAIIPYLILRYFFGDMQMFSEILLLLSIFLLSCLFTAATVGLSASTSVVVRVLLPIGSAIAAFRLIWTAFLDGRSTFLFLLKPVTLNSQESILTYIGFLIASVYAIWMLLDLGTSLIAPLAENRASRRRLVSIALIAITLLAFHLADIPADTALFIGLLLSIPVSIISLTENANLVAPVVAPFVRKKLPGTLAGRTLYPGWATGLIFVFILYALLHTLLNLLYKADTSTTTILNATFAALLFPVAMTRLFARKHENRFGLFMLFVCTEFLTVLIVFAMESWVGGAKLQLMPLLCWVPTSVIYLDDSYGFTEGALLNASYFNLILYAGIALSFSAPVWKHIRDVEKASQPAT